MSDILYLPKPRPFRFAQPELLIDLLLAEISSVNKLVERFPKLRELFDVPEASLSERKLCFTVSAHREVIDSIYETFAARYEEPPRQSEQERKAISSTNGLVLMDGPQWGLEIESAIDQLTTHLFLSLPKPLQSDYVNQNDVSQIEEIRSATETLTVGRLEMLINKVLEQQFGRLERRWLPTIKRRKPNKRSGWQQKVKLYVAIKKILSTKSNLQGMEFCAELDKRHAPPLHEWEKKGLWRQGLTWKEAWKEKLLRSKIRRVRQEAMKNRG